jgi:hypothetical protein
LRERLVPENATATLLTKLVIVAASARTESR